MWNTYNYIDRRFISENCLRSSIPIRYKHERSATSSNLHCMYSSSNACIDMTTGLSVLMPHLVSTDSIQFDPNSSVYISYTDCTVISSVMEMFGIFSSFVPLICRNRDCILASSARCS